MKSILIEKVSNGYIVRPYSSCQTYSTIDQPIISVYKTVEDIQKDLPGLLQFEFGQIDATK
jgi:hypothetical protein